MRTDVSDPDVTDTINRLLAAVPAPHRARVEILLSDRRTGGRGLWAMLNLIHMDQRPVPAVLSAELIEIYLTDDEAEPLHDCERCGLPVPVHAGRHCGHEATVERVYFPACPQCGGRTGRYAYWSHRTSN
ncbi:unnamed protein product [Gemmataceae bacterium]|nr:unnamed protein product [Gemmataceae bacterium]VTT99034.1 unnamed protein product [Gemmataceae bacterium]